MIRFCKLWCCPKNLRFICTSQKIMASVLHLNLFAQLKSRFEVIMFVKYSGKIIRKKIKL